jgi:hypothetical protein
MDTKPGFTDDTPKPKFTEEELLNLWEMLMFSRGKEFQGLTYQDFKPIENKIRAWFEEAVPGRTLR